MFKINSKLKKFNGNKIYKILKKNKLIKKKIYQYFFTEQEITKI